MINYYALVPKMLSQYLTITAFPSQVCSCKIQSVRLLAAVQTIEIEKNTPSRARCNGVRVEEGGIRFAKRSSLKSNREKGDDDLCGIFDRRGDHHSARSPHWKIAALRAQMERQMAFERLNSRREREREKDTP